MGRAIRAFLVIGFTLAVSGCGFGCEVDGVRHRAGETFLASDGCNQCTCQWDGTVVCTRMACLDDTGADTGA